MIAKGRKTKRKQQRRINASLKKRLYANVYINSCCYCLKVFLINDLTVEHIVPLSFGGGNEDSNITLACAPCNRQLPSPLEVDYLGFKRDNILLCLIVYYFNI